MGLISLQIPVTGQPNSTEDPKISSDFTTLQTLVNGQLTTENLSPAAAIKASQIAAGALALTYTPVSTNVTAATGQFIGAVGGVTITLPTPTKDSVVGITTPSLATGTSFVTVTAGAAKVFGLGFGALGTTTFRLGMFGASVLLQADGTNWLIVAGQADTGWLLLTNGTGVAGTAYVRVRGDLGMLRGSLQNTSGGSIGAASAIATLPLGTPGFNSLFSLYDGTSYMQWQVTTGGVISNVNTLPNNGTLLLDGHVYPFA